MANIERPGRVPLPGSRPPKDPPDQPCAVPATHRHPGDLLAPRYAVQPQLSQVCRFTAAGAPWSLVRAILSARVEPNQNAEKRRVPGDRFWKNLPRLHKFCERNSVLFGDATMQCPLADSEDFGGAAFVVADLA